MSSFRPLSTRRVVRVPGVALALALACSRQEPAPPLTSLAPAPLAPLPGAGNAGEVHAVVAAPVWGPAAPGAAVRVVLHGTTLEVGGVRLATSLDAGAMPLLAALGGHAAVLVPDDETYLAQAGGVLAALDDARVPTWLLHPDGQVAFPLVLRDEAAFGAWLDEPKPGKLRVIQRQDGLELVSGIGKVLGPDPNGPTVPVRGGRLDVATAREGLRRLQSRFHAPDACLVPSFGTELRAAATVLTAFWSGPKAPLFDAVCLVYPRPGATPGNATRNGATR